MKTIQQRLQHLQKIQDCIRKCQQYIDGDNRDMFKYADTWTFLGIDKRIKAQIEFRKNVIEKLTAFFAKKCFELSMEATARTKSPLLTEAFIGGNHVTSETIDDLQRVNL